MIQGAAWPRTATKNVEGRLHTGHRPDRPRVAFPGSAERGAASEARRCLAGKHRAAVNRSHRQADEAAAAAASRGHWAVLAPLASLTYGTPAPLSSRASTISGVWRESGMRRSLPGLQGAR